MTSDDDPTLTEILSTYGRLAYTHKTHEKEAERSARRSLVLRWANVTVFAITAAATMLAPLLQSALAAGVAAATAILGLTFSVFQLSFDPGATAASHRMAAKSYLSIRNQLSALIADARSAASITPAMRLRRDELAERARLVDDSAPHTSGWAYDRARDALKEKEELTFSRDELDALLPPVRGGESSEH